MGKNSPTQRSLAFLRKEGWSVCVVEKWLPPRGTMKFGRRIDAFGIADLLACRSDSIALIQCFSAASGSGFADHRAKILAIPEAEIWIRAGGKIFLQGWRRGGPRGAVKRWQMKQEEVVLA